MNESKDAVFPAGRFFMAFQGFLPDTFAFLLEIAFNNNKQFFEENRERYKQNVQRPLLELEEELAPAAKEIDPLLRTGRHACARIYRDTRYTKNKDPYRDHLWIGYKRPGSLNSEFFGIYFEITPVGYGYGMGCYAPRPDLMERLRRRMLADPGAFLEAIGPLLSSFSLTGDSYKRPKVPDAPEELRPYINRKNISFEFASGDKDKAMTPGLALEVRDAMEKMTSFYRYMHQLD